MKTYLKLLLLWLLILYSVQSIAQAEFQNIIPPSPEMAALGRYIDVPIDHHTGQANINIPLFTLEAGGIKQPISLSYHTGGIRVSDVSSWVGMGWSLNYSGFINRTVNGAPDGTRPIYLPSPGSSVDPSDLLSAEKNLLDTQHDFYHYSVLGNSGKFVLDIADDFHPILMPRKNLKIAKYGAGNMGNSGFTIDTPDGLKYIFNEIERTEHRSNCPGSITSTVKSGWRPSRIESNMTNSYITFTYSRDEVEFNSAVNENDYYNLSGYGGFNPPVDCNSTTRVLDQMRISEMNSSSGIKIKFIPGDLDRRDLSGGKYLERIEIYDNTSLVKTFVFDYKYLKGNVLYDLDANLNYPKDDLRLVLLGIQEIGSSGVVIPPYTFTYNLDHGLPSRFSKSLDYWGFYNGINNPTLVPSKIFNGKYYSGARRKPVLEYAKQGALSAITFPEGGSKSFTYSLNECTNCDFDYFDNSYDYFDVYRVGSSYPGVLEVPFEITGSTKEDVELSAAFTETDICDLNNHPPCFATLEVVKLGTNNSETIIFSTDDSQYIGQDYVLLNIDLTVGKYVLRQVVHDSEFAIDDFYLQVKWVKDELPNPEVDHKAGGLRVDRVEDYDPVADKTVVRSYQYINGTLNMSAMPVFAKVETYLLGEGGSSSQHCSSISDTEFSILRISSSQNYSLSPGNGGAVGYEQVIICEDDSCSNGSTHNFYYTWNDHPDIVVEEFTTIDMSGSGSRPFNLNESYVNFDDNPYVNPFPIVDEKDWKRGLLKRSVAYDSSGSKVHEKILAYTFYDGPIIADYDFAKLEQVWGFKQGSSHRYICSNGVDIPSLSPGVFSESGFTRVAPYRLTSTWYDLQSETIITYDGDKKISKATYYDNVNPVHLKPTLSYSYDSQGKLIESITKYPADFSTNEFGSNLLKNNHLHDIPLLEIRKINGVETHRDEIFYALTNGTIGPTNRRTYPSGSRSSYINTYINYGTDGRIREVLQDRTFDIAYLWSYGNNHLPVAKVVNATSSSVAFTSFENGDSEGGWTFTNSTSTTNYKTGYRAHRHNSYNISKSALPNDDYIVSFWARRSSTSSPKVTVNGVSKNVDATIWTYYEIPFTGTSVTVDPNNVYLDELRLFPKGAQMTSFTYSPGIGLTSQGNPNGSVLTFQYDDLGRLYQVKDKDGNVLKEYKYNYSNQ